MSDYFALKATINANIKANNNHEITGAITNSVLNAMVNSLGAGYQFMGVATPTNPGSAQTPDYKCFYLATTPGTYTYLGGLVVADGEVAILKWDTSWTKEVTDIVSNDGMGINANTIGQVALVASKYGRVAHSTKQVTEATGTASKTDFYDVSKLAGKTIFFQSSVYGNGFAVGVFLKSLNSWTNGVAPDYTATDYEFVYYGETNQKVVPADAKYFGLINYHTYDGVRTDHNNLVLSEDGFLRTLMKGIDPSDNPRIATIVVPSGGSKFSYNIKTGVFTFPANTAIKWKNADVDILGESKTITLSHNYGIVVYDTQTKAIADRYNTALQANEYVLFCYNKVFIEYFSPLVTTLPIDAIRFEDNNEAIFGQLDLNKIYPLIASAKYAFADNLATPLQLLWFSDIHGATDRLGAIKHIHSNWASMFDDVIATGDQTEQYFTDSFDWWAAGGANNFLQVIGNHEVWKGGSDYASVAETYQKYFAPFISNWNVVSPGANLCYYYKDYASSHIRLIVLDCMNWDDAQKNWLIATLASAKTANLNVLIAQHYMAGTPTPIECDYTAINVVQEGTISSDAPQAVQDFIDGGGSFICWIGGHYHADYIYALANYPGQYGILIGTASASQREKNNYRGQPLFFNLFSALQVDITYHQIKLVRFGANVDRWMRHKELVCFDYTNGNVKVY